MKGLKSKVVVTIDGRKKVIRRLDPRRNHAWRLLFVKTLDPLLNRQVPTVPDTFAGFLTMLPSAVGAWSSGIEAAHKLCIAYHPALRNALDSEVFDNLMAVLSMAVPLEQLAQQAADKRAATEEGEET